MAELLMPDPPLADGVVRLRPWRETDVEAIVSACADFAIARFSPVIPYPYGEHDAREWLAIQEPERLTGTALELAVTTPDDTALLGAIGLSKVDASQHTAR